MQRRPLGKTGMQVSVLGIGDVADRSVPLAQCVALIHRAMEYGLNLIDTAPNYESGYSEQIVGTALKGRRDGLFVIDKIDRLTSPVEPQVDASLRALEIEAVDLFVFHGVSSVEDWRHVETVGMPELAECREKGKVRFRGISSHHPDVLLAALYSDLCDVAMFPVGPFVNKRYIEDILPLARENGIGTVCFKTFGAGKLLDDTTGYHQPLEVRPRGKFRSGGNEHRDVPQLHHLTVAECLHYTLILNPEVTLLGMSFPHEQDVVFRAFESFSPLEKEQLKHIEIKASRAIEGKGTCWWNPADES